MTTTEHQRQTPPESSPSKEANPATSPLVPTTLWLIRHAEVDTAYHNVFGGRIDMALSPAGLDQAAALARYLHGRKFDAVYASPMKRVQQTLAACTGNGLPSPVTMAELREVDFGDWTGLSWDQVQAKFGISPLTWLEQLECDNILNAECSAALRARLQPAVSEVMSRHQGKQVALFCHGGVIRMLLAILLDWPFTRFAAVEIDYASVTQVISSGARARVQLLNFSPWRDLET